MNDTSAGRAVIEAATATWMDAFNNGDAATIARTMSPDAQIMPPNGNLIVLEKATGRMVARDEEGGA